VNTDQPTTASVLVCAYTMKRLPQIRRCLKGVLDGELRPAELIVVIDGNDELLRAVAWEFTSRASVRVVPSLGRGLSAARNTGLAVAGTDIVACIDDDASPDPRWLASIVATFDEHPAVAVVAGHILPDYEDPTRPLPSELLWLVGCTYRGHRTDPGPVSRPIGANMAFRTAAIREAGGFSTDFGALGEGVTNFNEEIVVSAALRERYGPDVVWYTPEAIVHHFVPAERTTWAHLRRRAWAEGRSKADVRHTLGGTSMGDDQRYARAVLGPRIVAASAHALTHPDRTSTREAAALGGAAALTAAGYLVRMVRRPPT